MLPSITVSTTAPRLDCPPSRLPGPENDRQYLVYILTDVPKNPQHDRCDHTPASFTSVSAKKDKKKAPKSYAIRDPHHVRG